LKKNKNGRTPFIFCKTTRIPRRRERKEKGEGKKKKKGRHTFASYTNAAHLKDFAGRNPTQQQKNRVLPLEAHARTIRARHKTSTH
jgi:hypothetical protein